MTLKLRMNRNNGHKISPFIVCFEICFHKAKTPISMVPFSMIFLGEFSIAIYN